MNPKKLGGKANHKQEPWKTPLPQYIEELYLRRFKKERPDNVRSIEQMVADKQQERADRKARDRQRDDVRARCNDAVLDFSETPRREEGEVAP